MFLRHNQSTRLAFQITILFAGVLLLALFLLILSLNNRYERNEAELAREKLSIIWTEVLNTNTISGFQAFRNTYNIDLDNSEKLYAVRVSNKNNSTLLLEYPKNWYKYFRFNMDFEETIKTDSPYRLKIQQGNRKTPSNFMVYSLVLSDYYIQVLISIEERIQFLSSVVKSGLRIVLLVMLMSFIVAHIVINRILRPLNNINTVIESIIDQPHITQRLEETGQREFIRIQKNFNIMLNVIEQKVNRLRQAAINLGHDIRTPLTRIRNQLEDLLKHSRNNQHKHQLENCLESIDEITNFAKQVLDLSEIDSKLVYVPKQAINIAESISDVIEMYTLISEEKCITIETQIDPSVEMYIDNIRIRQLIGNLLDNAVKFSNPKDTIIIKVYHRDNKNYLEIHDTGVGIEKEDLTNIWVPAWKKSNEEEYKSTGFGLAIVESIVHAYQGKIKVLSEKNKGTIFIVTF